jgi:tRNA (guanine37-N1)-methyltransferase
MRVDILTLFPAMFPGYLQESLLHKAIQRNLLQVAVHDIRQWSRDKHQKVDDRPYGGGPGMVLKVEPIVESIEEVRQLDPEPGRLILLTPQGECLTQNRVAELARQPRLILVCGRYEGFDQRVIDLLHPLELSIGDYILNGGEVAAMVVVDAVIRLIPGVLGDESSSQDDSFSRDDGWLESAQYTRPREYRGLAVPDILLSGDHAAIARWRREQSYQKTIQRRADLVQEHHDQDGRPQTITESSLSQQESRQQKGSRP